MLFWTVTPWSMGNNYILDNGRGLLLHFGSCWQQKGNTNVCHCGVCLLMICVFACLLQVCKSYDEMTHIKVCAWSLFQSMTCHSCTVFMVLCVCLLFVCSCAGVSANRSVRWDVAESSCHSPMSKLAAFTFHFQSLERVWPESSHHNALSCCPVSRLTLRADTLWHIHSNVT